MKNMLLFATGLLLSAISLTPATAQTVILSEDFSGFTTGSHSTPSTSDASSGLDSRMKVPGWHGSLIYSAGGEIKIGTASLAGWIETPALDLSDSTMSYTISFDIARWVNDATTVQLSVNDMPLGEVLTPGDSYTMVEILSGWSETPVHIKLHGLTKRFYLDNFTVTSGIITSSAVLSEEKKIIIWPVPASDLLHLRKADGYTTIKVIDMAGRVSIPEKQLPSEEEVINVSYLTPGVYCLILRGEGRLSILKFIKR